MQDREDEIGGCSKCIRCKRILTESEMVAFIDFESVCDLCEHDYLIEREVAEAEGRLEDR